MSHVEIAEQRRVLAVWFASLLLVIALFSWLGRGPLAGPSLSRPETWSVWLSRTDPVHATFALGRLLVLALAWYLAGVTALGALARGWGRLRLVRLADAFTVPMVRQVLETSLGLGLATAVVTTSTPARLPLVPDLDRGTPVATAAEHAQRDAPSPADPLWHLRQDDPEATTELSDPGTGAAPRPRLEPGFPWSVPGTSSPPLVGPAHVESADVRQRNVWQVEPGDHFWSIAERVVAERSGPDPSEDQVAPYWRRLIDANRGALVHPRDPDLIYPGQRFVLPP